jgi:tripartite-type tricarboxylate transporter receptor subunit TctC
MTRRKGTTMRRIGACRVRGSLRAILATLALLGTAGSVHAQAYPAKPVRIVAPFPAGGAADLMARLVADKLATALGQPFVVENRAGAGGTIGADAVAKSPGDGYTLLLGVTASQTIAPAFYAKTLPYVPERDFRPVAMVAKIPVALVVHPSVDAKTPQQLAALAKPAAPPLMFASSGAGAVPHLTAELWSLSQGVRMIHVPYKGAAPAMADLLGGRVQVMFDHLPTVLPHIRTGKLRALGIAGTERAKALPELPTLAEQGVRGADVSSWFGVLAPRATPDAVVGTLAREIAKAVVADDARARLDTLGAEAWPIGPDAFAGVIRADIDKWAKLVRATGATAD